MKPGPTGLRALLPSAPPALCAILDPHRGPLEPPIRSEIFGPQRFAQHGRSLGETHATDRARRGTPNFFPRLQDNIRTLREAQRYIGEQAASGYDISPAAEWLIDNFHLIEAQLKAIHEGLPHRYFRTLPMLVAPPLAGLPRVYGVAWAFVAHTDGAFDTALLTHFLSAYQETRPLNLNEMWALPTTLRVLLVENLRRLAERVATHKAAREAANLVCDAIDTYSLHGLDALRVLMDQRGAGVVFLSQMAQRLQGPVGTASASHLARYQAWLHQALPDLAATLTQHDADEAADNLSVSNAVTSLRAIGDADWSELIAACSPLMQQLLTSPIFRAEHPRTRDRTLYGIEALARRSGRSEREVAQTLLDLMAQAPPDSPAHAVARHWLQGSGRPALMRALGLPDRLSRIGLLFKRELTLPLYLMALLVGTALALWWLQTHHAAAAPHALWLRVGAFLLVAIPVSEAVVAVVNRLISESLRPAHLPRLALAQGIPPAHRVLVVIPAMLTSLASVRELVHQLHLHALANPEPEAQFALLTDWVDADAATLSSDAPLLEALQHAIAALNARPDTPASPYGAPRFVALHRPRLFSQSEQRWIGWERKRGKLEQLIAALAERHLNGFIDLGETSRLAPGIQYVVTLDSDTQLPPGTLRELVGVAAHPHNHPQLDPSGRQVIAGYAILQPHMATPLPSHDEFTLFHWLFAGQCGVDAYSASSSEIYQDLFAEGSFNGKGLLHVQAMHTVLNGRLPEGRVLSHDLLEGALARCAVVTDITVIEDAPFHADVAASRVHRWMRGDWQLLPFMLQPRRYRLKGINLWKMGDNLRRTLVAPSCLLLLCLALAGQLLSPWAALGVVLAAYGAGPLLGALAALWPSHYDVAWRHFYRHALTDLGRVLAGALWQLVQLIPNAVQAMDAIVRALFRLTISHRHLLQWTTAAAARASSRVRLRTVLRQHAWEPWVALALAAGLWAWGALPAPWLTLGLCLAWALSPLWTWWVSHPRTYHPDARLPPSDRPYLTGIARDTWRFFEHCVGPADRHLPPDNLQILPHEILAHRTSPTNIGLYLLSVACARQFGWIGTEDLLGRLEATLASLQTLERHHGHFLNWYDTQTGLPLLPRYVSSVDSGNLCGHLLAVGEACRELAMHPYDPTALQAALLASKARLTPLLLRRSQLSQVERDALIWLMADHRATLRSAARDDLARASEPTERAAAYAAARLRAVARTCAQLAQEADFATLYHPRRHLFHLGLRVDEQQLDAGFYDLLASESRLTGLWAIAKGDVPVSHWASLGRPFYALGAEVGVRSWSGSMFEYLMPMLVLNAPHGSVLRSASEVALLEQVAFARDKGVPWGISESAHAEQDHTLAYQYAPHGVPRLALRRTPPDELVIAPYATALAAQLAPHLATLNFLALEPLGARGRYGFIEALDYTPAQQPTGVKMTPVATYMAHHQGMSIVALANVLLGQVAQRWGMAPVHLEAVGSLLHERTPRDVSRLYAPLSGPSLQTVHAPTPHLQSQLIPGMAAIEPTHLLSNGRYQVTLRANGAGWSRWGHTDLSRWRDDVLRDAHGSFLYLRWATMQAPVSLTLHPAPDPRAHYQSTFHTDRVRFEAHWPHAQAHTTVWVSPEDDIEFRQVELYNQSDTAIELELMSAWEVSLSPARADEAHPAFANLFVRAEWQPEHQALRFERQPRLPDEPTLLAAHFLVESDAEVLSVQHQCDRLHWAGRNQHGSQPRASFPPATSPDACDTASSCETGLDPVAALSVRLRIAPHAKARVTFATAAANDPVTLHAIIDKYRQPSHVERASLMSATLSRIRLQTLSLSAAQFAAIQTLSTALLLTLSRAPIQSEGPNHAGMAACDRRLLWRLGIPGDRPLILVTVSLAHGLPLLRTLSQALRWWSWGGVACDLVVLDTEASSYHMALHHALLDLRDRHRAAMGEAGDAARTHHSAYHVLRRQDISDAELHTLHQLARLDLHADGRPLLRHVTEWSAWHEAAFNARSDTSVSTVLALPAPAAAPAPAQGHFTPGEGAFTFEVGRHQRPPRPWINVLANPMLGTHVSEAGGGHTWALNSQALQLTPWSNDPVTDPPAELFLLQDLQTHVTWSLTPSAWGLAGATYRVTHGQGYSTIVHRRGDLVVRLTWCVDAHAAIKQVQIHLHNHGTAPLSLRLVGLVEWLMGSRRSDRSTVFTARHRPLLELTPPFTALLSTQTSPVDGFGLATAFLLVSTDADDRADWTCDRRECFDSRGHLVLPDHFGRRSGANLDPCAALSVPVTVPGSGSVERVFLLGFADTPRAARALAAEAVAVNPAQRLAEARGQWAPLLDATTIETPDPLLDVLANRWLLYQTVSCRLWAKAGFYQAGGATGFRDQLQDTLALAWADPERLHAQILLCASRQFREGDVQHWWHSPSGAGVRTHFSDDLLWLPYACAHHQRHTGDARMLDETVPFLESPAIPEGAEDLFNIPSVSTETASVYEHAARAIDHSLRVGVHGLPLMGTGDWNDGMNRVGHQGRGESVWLGWFLCRIVADFAPLAQARGDGERAQRWLDSAKGWQAALRQAAWDGLWFKRAFFDDGEALGSQRNVEARIDLIAQAWAVLADVASPEAQHLAMTSVEKHLVDPQAGLIQLLTPPLQHARPSAGYIQAYPPGVRENGGQYNHAGVWAAMAWGRLAHAVPHVGGAAEHVYRYLTYLSPAHRAAHPSRGPAYGLEPYVMAGDVYTQPPYVGRGGWSWYTGSASWMHRAIIESLMGLQVCGHTLTFTPCLPSHWPQATLTLRRAGRTMRFVLIRASGLAALQPDEADWVAEWASAGSPKLAVGQPLDWTTLPETGTVVLTLAD